MEKLKLESGALVTTTPQQVMSAEDQVGVVRSNVESAQNLSDAEILAIGIGPTFLESYKKKYKVK